ncbi:PhzF family phenazine biosynthesis protein [Demequina muriae]|uniref:PhzF family phenazine biosynthesis protein n=1 Tax=Demequina muriae TaxID=3051664 RepID=A0ABT8GIB6_9MICO|nr:PhzF family phenazine biosynthesis protein [Demequina sp. EGI L300058]MDN4481169.1 PhzF family phenazine biosynthesis protein [Demequina sp. EGI L300058]
MSTHEFRQVDVFGTDPYTGNPVAVVLDAEGLSSEQMARISAWTNLSECTFVLPPTTRDADYRVRIFSLTNELPFAGHPTLGTARAWLDAGGVPRDEGVVIQECGAGLVPVRVDGDQLAFAAPSRIRSGAVSPDDLDAACRVLRITPAEVLDAAWADNGPGWIALLLKDVDAVMAVEPDGAHQPGLCMVGIAAIDEGDGPDGSAVEVRTFFNDTDGPLREDPITGSFNASLAQWLTESGRIAAPYVARQGTMLDRAGRVSVDEAGGDLWIGGRTHVAITGTIDA